MNVARVILLAIVTAAAAGCDRQRTSNTTRTVVIYVAVDQYYAEPILSKFEDRTGIRVAASYDTEAAKTTGLVHRLMAERDSPRADVFWNNEVVQTILLKRARLFARYVPAGAKRIPARYRDPEGYWTGLAARARVIVYNTQRLAVEDVPRSIQDLADTRFRSRVAVAYPLFGTTRTHAAALFAQLGAPEAQSYFTALVSNGTRFVDGNATVRDLTASGTVWVGLTDTDDVCVGMRRGLPIGMTFPDQDDGGTLVLPTSVAVLKNCPNPEAARRLVDFLISEDIEGWLATVDAAYVPLRPNVVGPADLPALDRIRVMDVDFDRIADAMPGATRWLRDHVRRGAEPRP